MLPKRIYPIMRGVNRRLQREKGWFLDCLKNRGYEIVMPGREIDVCTGVINQGVKRIHRGVAMMNHIRLKEIPTDAERTRTIEAQQRAAAMFRHQLEV